MFAISVALVLGLVRRPLQPVIQNNPGMVHGKGKFCTACVPHHDAINVLASMHWPLVASDIGTGPSTVLTKYMDSAARHFSFA